MRPNYFFKKYVLRYLEPWGILSGFLGFFFVLAKADFKTPEEERIFIISFWGFAITMSLIMFLRNGLLPLLGVNRFQDKDAEILNSFINEDGKVVENISNDDLEKLFYYLKKENIFGAIKGLIYPFLGVICFVLSTMHFAGTSINNLLIIFVGGVLASVILSSFIMFFSEVFFANTLKECREIMKKRGIKPDEKIHITSLKSKFNYFVFLSILLIFVTLSFIPDISLFLLLVIITAFTMITIMSKLLFSSIYSTFKEVEDFGKELTTEGQAEYFSGSSCKEVLDLSNNLNKSAEELYENREQLQGAYQEIKQRKEDLEKFYKLTVGRELKMIELKKKIKELEEKEKNGNQF